MKPYVPPTTEADPFWGNLVENAGAETTGPHAKPLTPTAKSFILYHELCSRYFERGEDGTSDAMETVAQYMEATGIDSTSEAKTIKQLFATVVDAAAHAGPGRDAVQILCFLVSVWAERCGLAETAVCIQWPADEDAQAETVKEVA